MFGWLSLFNREAISCKTPPPADFYYCEIVNIEMQINKKLNGTHMNVCLKILFGDYKGRFLWDNFGNTYEDGQINKIGMDRFRHFVEALDGHAVISCEDDLQELIGDKCVARIYEGDSPQYGEYNYRIVSYQNKERSRKFKKSWSDIDQGLT